MYNKFLYRTKALFNPVVLDPTFHRRTVGHRKNNLEFPIGCCSTLAVSVGFMTY